MDGVKEKHESYPDRLIVEETGYSRKMIDGQTVLDICLAYKILIITASRPELDMRRYSIFSLRNTPAPAKISSSWVTCSQTPLLARSLLLVLSSKI